MDKAMQKDLATAAIIGIAAAIWVAVIVDYVLAWVMR